MLILAGVNRGSVAAGKSFGKSLAKNPVASAEAASTWSPARAPSRFQEDKGSPGFHIHIEDTDVYVQKTTNSHCTQLLLTCAKPTVP